MAQLFDPGNCQNPFLTLGAGRAGCDGLLDEGFPHGLVSGVLLTASSGRSSNCPRD